MAEYMYFDSLGGALYETFMITGLFYETVLQQNYFQDGDFL